MANEQSNAQTRLLYQKYELAKSDVFASQKQGFQIITRTGIEKIQYKENINVTFEVVHASPTYCAIKATATKEFKSKDDEGKEHWETRRIETLASATKGEFVEKEKKTRAGKKYMAKVMEGGNTDSWYVLEIAEKRALSRAILKVTGLYEHGFFGEDENEEEFKPKTEKNKAKGQAVVDDIIPDGI